MITFLNKLLSFLAGIWDGGMDCAMYDIRLRVEPTNLKDAYKTMLNSNPIWRRMAAGTAYRLKERLFFNAAMRRSRCFPLFVCGSGPILSPWGLELKEPKDGTFNSNSVKPDRTIRGQFVSAASHR